MLNIKSLCLRCWVLVVCFLLFPLTIFANPKKTSSADISIKSDSSIELVGDDPSDKTDLYFNILKASLLHAKGKLAESFDAYKKVMDKKPSIHVYDGFMRLLFDMGQFQLIVNLSREKKAEFETFFKDNSDVKLIQAQAFLYTDQDDEAEKLFVSLLDSNPDDDQIAYYSAIAHIKSNELDRAIKILDRSIKNERLKSKHFLFHYLKSKICMMSKDFAQANKNIEKSLKLFPEFDRGWLFKAMLMEQQGKVNDAITGYKRFLDLAGGDEGVEKQLIVLLFSQKRFKEASEYLRGLKADAPEYYFDLALTEFNSNNVNDALDSINKALDKSPDFKKAKLLKIEILLAKGKIKKVLDLVEEWIRKQTNDNSVLKTVALIKRAGVEDKLIIKMLESVIDDGVENVGILSLAADLSLDAEKYKKSLSFYKKILPLVKNAALKSKVIFQIGYVYFAMGDFNQTEKYLLKIVENESCHPDIYNLLAYCYAKANKKLESALKFVNMAVKGSPVNCHYLDTKGFVLLRLGRIEESIKTFKYALSVAPTEKDKEKIFGHLQNAILIGKR
jgi:tetratricopeptide (TPR) repeat protein